jgi:hypothetical protein
VWVNLPEPPQDLMKLISTGKESDFMKKIVLPSSPGAMNEENENLVSQGN